MSKVYQLGLVSIGMSALLSSGCANNNSEVNADVEHDGASEENQGNDELPSPMPMVTIENSGGQVQWFAPELPGDEPEMVITIIGEQAPIIHPDLAEKVGVIQAYLAIVDENTALPASLIPYIRETDRAVINSSEQRRALRSENLEMQKTVELAVAESKGDTDTSLVGGCSNTQRSHARNAYGAAYSAGAGSSGSKTCGQQMNFHNADGYTFYCNIDNNSDCDYGLGQCDPDGCTTVQGRTRSSRARFQTSPGGSSTFANYGTRYRFGYKNCSATYTATMRRQRGGGGWIYTSVSPNSMQIRVGGGAYPPPNALALNSVAYGSWEEHRNWGTSAYPLNTVNMVAQTEGVLCGDIIQRFDTYDYPTGWCNNGTPLCDDNSCSGSGPEAGCWDY